LLANAVCLDNEIYLISAWSNDANTPLGLAIAVVGAMHGRPLVVLTVPGVLRLSRATAMWVAHDEDEPTISRALLEEAMRLCRHLGIHDLTIALCPERDPVVPTVATGLGFRPWLRQDLHQIHLTGPMRTDAYLATLRADWRYDFRRNLRRPGKASAEVVHAVDIPEPFIDRMWELQLDMFRRKEQFFSYRQEANLFRAIRERRGVVADASTLCLRDGQLLGYLVTYRTGNVSYLGAIGKAPDSSLNVYAALVAHALANELDHGASIISLSYTEDDSKRRLGCTPFPMNNLFVRIRN